MAQVINTNVASLNSQRQLSKSQSALNQSLERLSSGLRINSAKDDAAGMAISDRMTAQINGLNQAARNANDGISLAQTAEGGLNSIGDNLQRLRALAVQSANSSNSASDRTAINNEAKTLLAEITRVSGATQFNGTNLLDGTFSASQFQVGANANQTISMNIGGASTTQIGAYQQQGTAVNSTAFTGANVTITANGGSAVTIGASVASGSAGNNYIDAGSAAAKALAINAKTSETGVSATATNSVTGGAPGTANTLLGAGGLTINGVAIGAIAGNASLVTQGANAAVAINAQTSLTGVTAVANASTGALTLTAADGRDIKLEGVAADVLATTGLVAAPAGTTTYGTIKLSSGTAFTVGGTAASTGGLSTGSATLTALSTINLSTASGANDAISILDGALSQVDTLRADLGAAQNRFTSVVSNLTTSSENLSASRSRIQDADFAAETAIMSKNNILQQAGTAMLAQANSLPQQVLSLLK